MSECRIGVARMRLTPDREGPMAGWGPGFATAKAEPPKAAAEELYATAVALEDPSGARIVFVNADLHCGSRRVWEEAAIIAGIEPSQLVLAGTHTHEGPSQMYGGIAFAGASTGLSQIRKNTKRHASLIGDAISRALRALAPGGVHVLRTHVDGTASNRAVPAWAHYSDEERRSFSEDGPGAALAGEPHAADQLRDPRLTTLYAATADGKQKAALAWYAVHGTALGPMWKTFSADLWGWARQLAEDELDGVVVGLAGGSSGDVSPLPLDSDGYRREGAHDRPVEQGSELAETVGERIGRGLVAAVRSADATDFTVGVAHEMWAPVEDGLPQPIYGMHQFGGGIDGPTGEWERLEAGIRSPWSERVADRQLEPSDPHYPKTPWLEGLDIPLPLGRIPMAPVFRRVIPRQLPLHVIRVGTHLFGTVPGEPTTMTGWRIERALVDVSGSDSASVIGFANDYCAYWATPEEYLEQRYEGASTVFGRDASTHLINRLAALAASIESDEA